MPATRSDGRGLPPANAVALRTFFDPLLEPVGQHVTRAGLYDLDAGYVESTTGTHLALYAEPIDPAGVGWDGARYVESIMPGMAAVTPVLFAQWPELTTMDLCQEPPEAVAPGETPPIRSQVVLARADSDALDWTTATLADLLALAPSAPGSITVRVAPQLESEPAWLDAVSGASR